MKNKIIILVSSIILGIIVVVVGLVMAYKDSKKVSLSSQTEKLAEESANTESSKAETTTQQQTTVAETTTEQQTTQVPTQSEEPEQKMFTIDNPNPNIDPSKPMVALTFDDGPDSEKTNQLLDVLEQYGGRATFFVVGSKISGNEDVIKRASNLGCEIGNHTMNHLKLTELTIDEAANEIHTLNDMIISLTNQKYVICRPPYGDIDENIMAMVDAPIILWSIDTLDWKTKDVNQTIANVQQNVSDGDIILLHDIHQESIDAAVQIIPWLTSQGYQLVTVSELGYYKRGGLKTGVKYGALR